MDSGQYDRQPEAVTGSLPAAERSHARILKAIVEDGRGVVEGPPILMDTISPLRFCLPSSPIVRNYAIRLFESLVPTGTVGLRATAAYAFRPLLASYRASLASAAPFPPLEGFGVRHLNNLDVVSIGKQIEKFGFHLGRIHAITLSCLDAQAAVTWRRTRSEWRNNHWAAWAQKPEVSSAH